MDEFKIYFEHKAKQNTFEEKKKNQNKNRIAIKMRENGTYTYSREGMM